MSGKIINGWFYEKNTFFGGQTQAIEVAEILYEGKSKYQDILVFKSNLHGVVLVLDGAIQCTSFDEFSYQEMITFLPLNSHPCPKKVLVIGGGDGGVLREISKHPLVEETDLCELDEEVVNVSKKFIPEMAAGFTNPKVRVLIEDGFKFLKENVGSYDVVIMDLSDPDGPSEMLYSEDALKLINSSLTENGVACIQGESTWLMLDMISKWTNQAKNVFPVVKYATLNVPTYPCGQIGLLLLSKSKETDFTKPFKHLPDLDALNLKYYSYEIHTASFTLPYSFQKKLQ